MHKHSILFFLALLLFDACSRNNTAGVIKEDKMIRILCDVHIIDGSMNLHAAKDSIYKYGTNRYGLLFKKYGVDSATFNNSLKYYAARPDEMIKIYQEIAALLIKKSDSTGKELNKVTEQQIKNLGMKQRVEKKRRDDSLRRDSVRSLKPI